MNRFTVWYNGTVPRYLIRANTRAEAIEIFARAEGISPSAYIQARKSKKGETLTDYESGNFVTVEL